MFIKNQRKQFNRPMTTTAMRILDVSLLALLVFAQLGSTKSQMFRNTGSRQISNTRTITPDNDNSAGNNDVMDDSSVQAALNQGLARLMQASSIQELIDSGLLSMNGHHLTAADLNATVNNSTGQLMVSEGEGVLPVPAMCSPRETSVAVRDPNLPSNSRLYPSCIIVPRCGGCCGSPDLECTPTYRERQVYNLLEIRREGSGMDVVNRYQVEIERHISCECRCMLNQEKCGPTKMFVHSMCSCICLASNRQCDDPDKIFNPDACGCVCREKEECCNLGEDRCFLRFNENTCECDIDRTLIAASPNVTHAEIEAYQQRHRVNVNPHSTQLVPTTTTTTARPTPASDPCAHANCPGFMVAQQQAGGNCRCVFGGHRRRHG